MFQPSFLKTAAITEYKTYSKGGNGWRDGTQCVCACASEREGARVRVREGGERAEGKVLLQWRYQRWRREGGERKERVSFDKIKKDGQAKPEPKLSSLLLNKGAKSLK